VAGDVTCGGYNMGVDQREKNTRERGAARIYISTCNFGQSRDFATSEKK